MSARAALLLLPAAALFLCACFRFLEVRGSAGGDGGGDSGDAGHADGGPTSDLVVGSAECGVRRTVVQLDRRAPAGDTLLVVFFMREPGAGTSMVTGAGLEWTTDLSHTTPEGSNRRHVSLFRARVGASLAAGAEIAIDHPDARATGAVVLLLPGEVALRSPGPPEVREGLGTIFRGTAETEADAGLCVVAHHNNSSATFAPGWTRVADHNPFCGGSRESGGFHLAVQAGPGTLECTGTLGANLGWSVVVLGYDGLGI